MALRSGEWVMHKVPIRKGGCALALAAALAFGACAAPTPTPAPEPETLRVRYWQAPSTLNPYLSAGDKDEDAGAVVLEPLANYAPDGGLVPRLAVGIPTPANGGVAPDLRSVTWTLREGLRWSDGSPMTASDAVLAWRYCADEATGCAKTEAFDGVTSVEAPDDRTIRIAFSHPTPYPYTAFVGAAVPIISEAQFASCIGAPASACADQSAAPLGTGPYRVVEFAPDDRAVYERNPFYWGAAPYFDRVVIQGGGSAIEAAQAVLERGEADYAWNLQVEPDALRAMEANGRGEVAAAFAGLTERLFVNQTNPDPALGESRSEYLDGANPHPFLTFTPIPQAMSMAVDRAAVAALYGFAGKPACNVVAAPANYASTANDGCLAQDIAGANRLLDESGVRDSDGDGVREYEGVPLRVTLQTTDNAVRARTQELIRDWWRAIGVETELVQREASVFFGGDPATAGGASYRRFFADVQMFTNGPEADPQQFLAGGQCGHIPTRENNWTGGNVARFCDPAYDALYARLAETPAGPERESVVKRLNDHIVQGYRQIPLVNRGLVSARLTSLRGVRSNAWDSDLWNIGEWRR